MSWQGKLSIYIVACLVYLSGLVVSHDSYLLIRFLDVGQGDAVLVVDNQAGLSMLVDGGPYSKVIEELDQVLPFWQRRIELVMATHLDDDHISGLVEVMRRYEVVAYLGNGETKKTPSADALTQILGQRGVAQRQLKKGDTMRFSSGLSLKWWWPTLDDEQRRDSNDSSQVVLLQYGWFSCLLTGDISHDLLQSMIDEQSLSAITVLKLPHHGSRTGLRPEILAAARPQIGVVSAGGDNRYGHPHPEVLQMLADYDVEVLRTDQGGAIELRVRGDGFSVYR